MNRARMWEEFQHRAIPAPEGPILARAGQVVIVAVADNWGDALKMIAELRREEKQGG